jgi:hypothetical protein
MNVQFFNAMIGVIGGFGAGVAYTFVRKLGKQGERGPVIVMCFSVFSCIVTAPFLFVGAKPMSAYQIVMLLFAGAAATGGQLSITKAYTKAPAKEISVFDYSQVIFAAMLGFVLAQLLITETVCFHFLCLGERCFQVAKVFNIKECLHCYFVFYLLFLIYIALESFFLNLDACKVCMQTLQTWQKLRLGTERVRSRYGAGPVKLLSVPDQ